MTPVDLGPFYGAGAEAAGMLAALAALAAVLYLVAGQRSRPGDPGALMGGRSGLEAEDPGVGSGLAPGSDHRHRPKHKKDSRAAGYAPAREVSWRGARNS